MHPRCSRVKVDGWPGVGARSLKNLPRCPIEPVNSCYLVNLQVRLFGCVRCADAGGGLCLLSPFVGVLVGWLRYCLIEPPQGPHRYRFLVCLVGGALKALLFPSPKGPKRSWCVVTHRFAVDSRGGHRHPQGHLMGKAPKFARGLKVAPVDPTRPPWEEGYR